MISPEVAKSEEINNKQQQDEPQKQNQRQTSSSKSKQVIGLYMNKEPSKDKKMLSHFLQTVTQIGLKSVPTFKINPILLINKIQQSRPQYKNSIVNKELAYDILLETQKTVKVKNCISPTRPNSQIYKRLSKNFFENLKNGIDQCILFTGAEPAARVQSSIGNQNNPGIFMIVAIAILDEKYKQNHERFDAQFSFLEYRGQKMYDLINYTEHPLIAKVNESKSMRQKVHNIEFGEHYVKVCTFLQFIRLYKVALFNNKERDIRTNKQKSAEQFKQEKEFEYKSSFIMKVRIKKYNADSKLIFQQETVLIDLDENSSFRNNAPKNESVLSQNQSQMAKHQKRTSQVGSRTLLDFILIEINNSNPENKPIHYHMVQKNLLLQIIKKYLRVKQPSTILPKNISNAAQNHSNKFKQTREQQKQYQVGGYLFVINSFTVNPLAYEKNMKLYENLTLSIGEQWQGIAKAKNTQKKQLDLAFAQTVLNHIILTLRNQKYKSFRDLYAAKEFYADESKKIISDIKLYRGVILDYSYHKKNLTYNKNLLTAYQLQLIGKCIKSDNFKEFYASKSYLALPREIQIKTQNVKTQIKDQMSHLKLVQEKFHLLKKKQNQNKKSTKIPQFIKNLSFVQEKQKQKHLDTFQKSQQKMQKMKFKIISRQQTNESDQLSDFQSFNGLKKYVYEYFNEIWHRVLFDEQRTIPQQFIFEDNLANDIRNLKQNFKIFIKQIETIDETKIKYFSDEPNTEIQNLNKLMRSVHLSKKAGLNYQSSSKLLKKQLSASLKSFNLKKDNLSQSKMVLPKIHERQNLSTIKQKSISSNNSQVIEIKGKVNFGTLLLNPKKLA